MLEQVKNAKVFNGFKQNPRTRWTVLMTVAGGTLAIVAGLSLFTGGGDDPSSGAIKNVDASEASRAEGYEPGDTLERDSEYAQMIEDELAEEREKGRDERAFVGNIGPTYREGEQGDGDGSAFGEDGSDQLAQSGNFGSGSESGSGDGSGDGSGQGSGSGDSRGNSSDGGPPGWVDDSLRGRFTIGENRGTSDGGTNANNQGEGAGGDSESGSSGPGANAAYQKARSEAMKRVQAYVDERLSKKGDGNYAGYGPPSKVFEVTAEGSAGGSGGSGANGGGNGTGGAGGSGGANSGAGGTASGAGSIRLTPNGVIKNDGTAQGGGSQASGGSGGPVKIGAWSILPAELVTRVNTDKSKTVLLEITSGPLRGARLGGEVSLAGESARMTLNSLSYEGQPYPVDAVGIDLDAGGMTAIQGEVDHHYLERYGAFMAAQLLAGYSEALGASGATTQVTDEGDTTRTTPERSDKELAVQAVGKTGEAIAPVLEQNLNRPITVKIPENTLVGVLFKAPVRGAGLPEGVDAGSL